MNAVVREHDVAESLVVKCKSLNVSVQRCAALGGLCILRCVRHPLLMVCRHLELLMAQVDAVESGDLVAQLFDPADASLLGVLRTDLGSLGDSNNAGELLLAVGVVGAHGTCDGALIERVDSGLEVGECVSYSWVGLLDVSHDLLNLGRILGQQGPESELLACVVSFDSGDLGAGEESCGR